jgi:hypothetical protein
VICTISPVSTTRSITKDLGTQVTNPNGQGNLLLSVNNCFQAMGREV